MRNHIMVLMLTSMIMNSFVPPIQPGYNGTEKPPNDVGEISQNAMISAAINNYHNYSTGITPDSTASSTPQPSPEYMDPVRVAAEQPSTVGTPHPADASAQEGQPESGNTEISDGNTENPDSGNIDQVSVPKPIEPDIRTITLTFAGDCTIGDDDKYSWNTFDSVYNKTKDPGYFFRGVQDVFSQDDFTFINLEGTFTNATKKAVKEYRFKGDPSYISVLKEGSIEGVTLANNHSMDYLDQGFKDTVAALDSAGIPWTYFEKNFTVEIKGLKIGFLGYKGWEYESKSDKLLADQVKVMRQQGVSFIVANYHWGDQNSYVPNSLQKRMAHFAIDNGVDLVIGHHPHVLQGRELYKGKPILYSLGNFCFGGAPNPSDKDTVIYQTVISYDASALKIIGAQDKIIPARVSSETRRNDYRPVIASADEGKRILEKFERISRQIK